ncbi:hypothetical protein [Bradyrhizobium brasilense]|uniref:hypothetical protein n=1 Tax=Bradyrhizobium brasilense TaxID=1419277 RepID=UPI001E448B42|nr:hypothetical protein [Bradyrhizobium brasilense]MCC8969173.1 hypothetical protein [Bradyrhizobium brasilense]
MKLAATVLMLAASALPSTNLVSVFLPTNLPFFIDDYRKNPATLAVGFLSHRSNWRATRRI